MAEKLPSTLEVVAERIKSDSRPGRRDDPYWVSIILQGGAMRGVGAAGGAGELMAILNESDSEPFDQTDDSSGGTFCWGYLANRNPEGVTIYYEELAKGFIGYRNRLTKGRFIDTSILRKAVSEGAKRLDFENILNHPTATHFYASSGHDAKTVRLKTGQPYQQAEASADEHGYSYPCKTEGEVLEAMMASAHLPYWAGPPLERAEQMHLFDGGLTAGRVPLQEAIADGCSHVLIVSTDRHLNPLLYKKKFEEKLAAWRLKKKYPEMAARYWVGFERHIEVLQILGSAANRGQNPAIDVIKVPEAATPSSTETDPRKLYAAAEAGRQAVADAFRPYGLKRDPKIKIRPPRSLIFPN